MQDKTFNGSAYKAALITLSDSAFLGERVDESGFQLRARLIERGYTIVSAAILPDDEDQLRTLMMRIADEALADIIFTTGGTGLSPRDHTPEATLSIADRIVPGIAEAMRAYSLKITPYAILSRAVSVIRKRTLIINLPGSPRGVQENLDAVLDSLPHALAVLRGEVQNCV